MMEYEESMELTDKTACSVVRADLKKCLLQSDCVKKVILLCRFVTTLDHCLCRAFFCG